jgi:hypothetical protein
MAGVEGLEPPTHGLEILCKQFSTAEIIEFTGPLNPTCITDKALFALKCDAKCDAVFLSQPSVLTENHPINSSRQAVIP